MCLKYFDVSMRNLRYQVTAEGVYLSETGNGAIGLFKASFEESVREGITPLLCSTDFKDFWHTIDSLLFHEKYKGTSGVELSMRTSKVYEKPSEIMDD